MKDVHISEASSEDPTADAPAKSPPASTVATAPRPAKAKKPQTRTLPPYHVVLLDDDDHTHEYVIEMLRALFAHPVERGMQLAIEVDTRGRVIVLTTHREHAELKRDQIHSYGSDERVATCVGSMSAMIEPAQAP
jgi:ATP-dependent Clp protease adaptor protein ClpS